MQYTLKLNINLSRKRVIELFDNPDNWGKWQESLISYETVSGNTGETGSKTKLLHSLGRRKTEMIETVELNKLPKEMVCIYEAPRAWNRVVYRFTEVSSSETLWELDSEFRCSGFLKVMTFLMPGMFKKATKKDMDSFKKFAESN